MSNSIRCFHHNTAHAPEITTNSEFSKMCVVSPLILNWNLQTNRIVIISRSWIIIKARRWLVNKSHFILCLMCSIFDFSYKTICTWFRVVCLCICFVIDFNRLFLWRWSFSRCTFLSEIKWMWEKKPAKCFWCNHKINLLISKFSLCIFYTFVKVRGFFCAVIEYKSKFDLVEHCEGLFPIKTGIWIFFGFFLLELLLVLL